MLDPILILQSRIRCNTERPLFNVKLYGDDVGIRRTQAVDLGPHVDSILLLSLSTLYLRPHELRDLSVSCVSC